MKMKRVLEGEEEKRCCAKADRRVQHSCDIREIYKSTTLRINCDQFLLSNDGEKSLSPNSRSTSQNYFFHFHQFHNFPCRKERRQVSAVVIRVIQLHLV
jgi:hypothetical protein